MIQNSVIRRFLNELRPSPRKADDNHDAARQADLDERAAPVLRAAQDPTLRAVLKLHRPVVEPACPWPVCRGCDSLDAMDAEPPEWPCRTWTLIQQALTP